MHTGDFMLMQLSARAKPFLFSEGGGAGRSSIPTPVESCKENPVISQALARAAHEIRGPVTSVQASEGREPGQKRERSYLNADICNNRGENKKLAIKVLCL